MICFTTMKTTYHVVTRFVVMVGICIRLKVMIRKLHRYRTRCTGACDGCLSTLKGRVGRHKKSDQSERFSCGRRRTSRSQRARALAQREPRGSATVWRRDVAQAQDVARFGLCVRAWTQQRAVCHARFARFFRLPES